MSNRITSSPDKKPNSERDDETLVNVGPNSTNAPVASSFSLSTQTTHPSTFAAYKMLQQLDEKNDGSSHWVLMSLIKLLYEHPNLLVKELIDELEKIWPNAVKSVVERFKQQGVLDD
jgi:hypothetical protein